MFAKTTTLWERERDFVWLEGGGKGGIYWKAFTLPSVSKEKGEGPPFPHSMRWKRVIRRINRIRGREEGEAD